MKDEKLAKDKIQEQFEASNRKIEELEKSHSFKDIKYATL